MSLLPCALLVVLAGAEASPEPPERRLLFVQGTLVNLRAAPSERSARVARLHIHTRVRTLDERGEWIKVALLDRESVQGWLRQDLLGDAPRVRDLQDRHIGAVAAGDVDGALVLAERLAALEPAHLDVVAEDLVRAHRPRAAARARAQRDGRSRAWVAICHAGRAQLIGSFEAHGSFAPLPSTSAEQAEVLATLDGFTWFSAAGILDGSPFVRPFAAPLYNEQPEGGWSEEEGRFAAVVSPFRAGTTQLGDPDGKLILGPCSRAGDVFSTAPFMLTEPQWMGTEAPAAQDAAAMVRRARPVLERVPAGHAVEGVSVLPVADGASVSLVRVTHQGLFPSHDGDAVHRGTSFALVSEAGGLLPFREAMDGEADSWRAAVLTEPAPVSARFLRRTAASGSVGVTHGFVLAEGLPDEGAGALVHVLDLLGDRFRLVTVMLEGQGC